MDDKEKKIWEQRTMEATRKGLMGAGGKIGTVVRFLGQPITVHDAYNGNHLQDPCEENDQLDQFNYELKPGDAAYLQKQIPMADIGDYQNEEPTGGAWREDRDYERIYTNIYSIGWCFDGLSSGLHMEAKYMEEDSKLTLFYKGYLVYREEKGELNAYVPNDAWEDIINKLYVTAKKKAKKFAINEKNERDLEVERAKKTWLQTIRDRWGI